MRIITVSLTIDACVRAAAITLDSYDQAVKPADITLLNDEIVLAFGKRTCLRVEKIKNGYQLVAP